MEALHAVSDFLKSGVPNVGALAIDGLDSISIETEAPSRFETTVTYWYEGRCPQSDRLLRLPRTPLVEAIARGLMQQLSAASGGDVTPVREGKMYGVLLVALPCGEQRVLKAFSGLLGGQSEVAGWVPPLPGRGQVALAEARTLEQLENLKQQLIALSQRPERQHYNTLLQTCKAQLEELGDRHRDRKQQRQQQRQLLYDTLQGDALTLALETLNQQSQHDGMERRRFKQKQNEQLQPLAQQVEQIETTSRTLKQQRKQRSQQLQAQLHDAYWMTNFLGESRSLQHIVMGGSMPTGTGDCCAPKLLHYAATHHLTPLSMAEFWWGADSVNQAKVQGKFYEACGDRCQPLMGFLLAGLSPSQRLQISSGTTDSSQPASSQPALKILYEDDWLIAVDKPAGLLSVPGRYHHTQDSVLSRLQCWFSQHQSMPASPLTAVHRLDQDTSGVLLLARHPEAHRALSLQFQQRQVHKLYEALLAGIVTTDAGVIELPLWGDPQRSPYQQVDRLRGKPSTTRFRRLETGATYTRMELMPLTGRTHQLRVHAADPQGLGVPIVGDRLYGSATADPAPDTAPEGDRLYLHARELTIQHPQSRQLLHLQSQTPF